MCDIDEELNTGNGRDDELIKAIREARSFLHMLYDGNGSQKNLLMYLLENGPVTQRVLTDTMGVKPSSMSEIISKLEKSGLVVKTPDPKEYRTRIVSITDDGIRVAEEERIRQQKVHELFLSPLDSDEKAVLMELLHKLNAKK
ncbi:MAG: winged helix DNA-binding protein [Clostridia bacterium]|nr:winged helix DNA-binding protein [Clostridia bacterium]